MKVSSQGFFPDLVPPEAPAARTVAPAQSGRHRVCDQRCKPARRTARLRGSKRTQRARWRDREYTSGNPRVKENIHTISSGASNERPAGEVRRHLQTLRWTTARDTVFEFGLRPRPAWCPVE